MIIKTLTPELEHDYERLLEESPASMFNHSLKYLDFLKQILTDSEYHYICAYEGDQLLAALPVFIKHGALGAVVNSLPFYGSHGGIVGSPNLDAEVSDALFLALKEVCLEVNAFSCTVIESPWDPHKDRYRSYNADLFDERIGQITSLPERADESIVGERLMSLYHQKTRNMVRKGLKGGFDVKHDGSMDTISALHAIHDENIRAIGGLPKPKTVFQAIQKVFTYDEDYRVYTAMKDGRIIAAVLLFYYKDTVEYFCPATIESYRNQQPLSMMIYLAMRDAVIERNEKYWNWGGTWLSQRGVYKFKSRWGTKDHHYKYHIKLYKEPSFLRALPMESYLHSYPYFYTIPFHLLKTDNG